MSAVRNVRANRDGSLVAATLSRLKAACATETHNVMPTLIDAVNAFATEGEIVEAMVEVFGRYTERAAY